MQFKQNVFQRPSECGNSMQSAPCEVQPNRELSMLKEDVSASVPAFQVDPCMRSGCNSQVVALQLDVVKQ